MASDGMSNELHNQQPMQTTWNCQTDLSFDEVSKLFAVPIAEAATVLGVLTNDLQRICRENGVPRWPYRKILAGKTIEDIKKEAAKEKKLLEEMGQISTHHDSNSIPISKSGSLNFGTSVPVEGKQLHSHSIQKQSSLIAPIHAVRASSLRPLKIDHRSQLHHQFHLRVNTPTFLDDFRHGFPRTELSVFSTQWWGNALSEETEKQNLDKVEKDVIQFPYRHSHVQEDELSAAQENGDCNKAKSRETSRDMSNQSDLLAASILVRTRKKAVTNGRKGLGIAVTRGYGAYRLGAKDEALLRAVFQDSLPSLWTAALFS